MAVIQTGTSTAGVANVDANFNLKTTTPQVNQRLGGETAAPNFVGAVRSFSEIDAGSVSGIPTLRSPYCSTDNRLEVGLDTILANYTFSALTQNTAKWKHAFTTMTMTQSAGFLNVNPALATVSGNYASLSTWRYFTLLGDGGLHVENIFQTSAMLPANQIWEHGLFAPTAGTVPLDGIFWRLTNAGVEGIMSYNGVETSTGILLASFPVNTNLKRKIALTQREASFWIDDTLYATLLTPAGNAIPYLTIGLPYTMLMRNSGTVTGGATVKIGGIHITQSDFASTKTWTHQMCNQGNAYQGQDGDTMGSLAQYSNAALAAAAALVNTSAAAQFTGLGGVALVLPTLTAGTDGILFSYLNPAGSITQQPKTLIITGVALDASVQTALTGGPLSLVMGIAYGHTAVSLATAETGSFVTATTKAPRRVPLGIISFLAAAAAGTGITRATFIFQSPIAINPGEYFAITCRNVGVVTTAGALVMSAMVDHYFE